MIVVEPRDWPDREALVPLALKAAQHLGLAEYLDEVTLVADDLSADDRPWLQFPSPRRTTLYCHPDHFRNVTTSGFGALPATLPWELNEPPVETSATDAFSSPVAERFLHHHFLLLHDLVSGAVRPTTLARDLLEAFQEAWAVTVDGRLRRLMLPGWTTAERRRRFFRIFSAGGLLLPRHWRIFHELWDLEVPDQETLRELTAELPALTSSAAGQD